MKRFLKKLLLFLALPLAICVTILLTPLERKYALKSLPVDCQGRGVWIYNRLFADSTPVDIAFLGTSHTINGIMDTLMEGKYHEQGKNIHVLNMGYCRFGTDLTVTLARDLFATKKTKTIVLEIEERMTTSSHPVYPYYASTEDLLHPASYVQLSYPENIYEGFLARLSQLRDKCFHVDSPDSAQYVVYGYRGNPAVVDPSLLIPPVAAVQKTQGAWRKLETSYPEAWTQRLINLCRENGARIVFLYVPAYHDQAVPEEGVQFYSQYGKVLFPPSEILSPKENWRDPEHLNDRGAAAFSAWLAGQLN